MSLFDSRTFWMAITAVDMSTGLLTGFVNNLHPVNNKL